MQQGSNAARPEAGKAGVYRAPSPRILPTSNPIAAITALGPSVRAIISTLPQSTSGGRLS